MMTSNKELEMVAIIPQQSGECCCMCGDSGLTQELFHCKVCQFRSQHRYCSNIYPKALSYKVCNWCLHDNQKEDSKSQNSSNSSPSDLKGSQRNYKDSKLQVIKSPIKKSKSSEKLLPIRTRKRIIRNAHLEEKLLRRTKSSEEISNNRGVITKQVFRNKVRRYKFLDEVSS